MLRTLFGKFLVVLLAFGATMTAIFAVIMQSSHENYHLELDQRAATGLARRIVAQDIGVYGGPELPANLDDKLARVASLNTGVDLYVLDAQGNVLASSVPPTRLKRHRIDMSPVRRYLPGDATLPILGGDPTDASRNDVFSAASIAADAGGGPFLYALLHRREHQAGAGLVKASYLLGEGIWMVSAGTIFAVLSSLLIARMLTRRLSRLAGAMKKFRQSEFSVPPMLPATPPKQSEDEVAQLDRTFVDMAQRMIEQMGALTRVDTLRRELLANISHELRTPLNSLQRHLETLTLEDSAFGGDDRRRRLEIAASQASRMSKLVIKLFELATLEAHQVTLEREVFALPDLAQDAIQRHSLAAMTKGVDLKMNVPAKLPLVYADIGLIERVIDNLVGNALHHTAPGGAVEVRLSMAEEGVSVAVSDTGGGIAPADLPRVFNRFFQGESNRQPDSNAMGIGLAIAKNILELHGTDIRVISIAGIGTTFEFALPAREGLRSEARVLLGRLTGPIRIRQVKA